MATHAQQLEQMQAEHVCSSCKINIAGAKDVTRFPCPQCGNEVTRCGNCRRIVAQYQCTCGFLGPN